MATLASTLKRRIAESTNEGEQLLLQAELSAYAARCGDYAGARDLLAAIRSASRWSSPRLSAACMFAEAMVLLRDDYSVAALDRLKRGHAIATAARQSTQVVDFASWVLHFEFNRGHFSEMERWLRQCEDLWKDASDHARGRLCLTFAAAAAYCGDFAKADLWYQVLRRIASALGDEAFLAASMYNRPAQRIAAARLAEATGTAASIDVGQLMLEIESARNYAEASGNGAALALQSLWRARAQMLEGRFADALPAVLAARDTLPEASVPARSLAMELDVALCMVKLGQSLPSDLAAEELAKRDLDCLELDDLLIAIHQLREVGLTPSGIEGIRTAKRARIDEQIAQRGTLADLVGRFARLAL